MAKVIENLKEDLIKEGKKALIEKRYKEMNIRSIAKNCNIGVGTFYNYFKNKDIFVNEIFANDWAKIIYDISSLESLDMGLKEKTNIIYKNVEAFLCQYMAIFYEIMMVKGSKLTKHERFQYMDEVYDRYERILQVHKERGEVKNLLSLNKLSKLIVSNILFIIKDKTISFDELYESLNI